jgi:hypothetical protein
MTSEYANLIKKEIKNFNDIQAFLQSDDENRTLYESVVTELNAKIVAKRKDYHTYDEIIESIYGLYVDRDIDLKKHKPVLRQLLYFMFWYCDIGNNTENA